jgi:inner membrane protein
MSINLNASYMYKKILSVAAVIVLILIALNMIAGVATDREQQRTVAVENISNSLAGSQTLFGPVLTVSCKESWIESVVKDKQVSREQRQRTESFLIPPDTLTLNSDIKVSSRSRGIYQAQVFNLDSTAQASWAKPITTDLLKPMNNGVVACEQPNVFMSVKDARGIRAVKLQVNNQLVEPSAGSNYVLAPQGFHTVLNLDSSKDAPLKLDINLNLVGTQFLNVVPVGKKTTMNLSADWQHPSFIGRVLPVSHVKTPTGFQANWQASELSGTSGISINTPESDGFKVDFINPTDPYVLGYRAANYGFLFVILTFVAVLMLEVLKGNRVHPIQYLLVGSAISIFFLLLISLSEHIGFNMAYVTAAIACVSLLFYYARFMLGSWYQSLPFVAFIAVLYGFLFVLLKLEQTALLVGSLGLFAILTTVMVMTRHVNWYSTPTPPTLIQA